MRETTGFISDNSEIRQVGSAYKQAAERNQMSEVGEITTRVIHVPVCRECGCVIDETGLCDQSCKYDASIERPPDTVECHVHKRTDEYVRKEPFHSSASAEEENKP